MPASPMTPAQLALEQAGLEFLRDGKFRKARDAFKPLSKSHPSRALPLLIEANLGLANAMMSKGLVSEAQQVLAYLKTIAPASLNLTLSPGAGETSGDAWATMVPLAAQRLATSTQPGGCVRAADEMILGATSPDHPGHPDARAILAALELGYGSAAAAQTAQLLRAVPRSSPFSHWVLFFKGMTAMETGDHARAADCFRRVAENSLLQPSIAALLTICGAPATALPTPRTVHALCAWAGQAAVAEPLLLAEPLWRKKQCSKAFTFLTKKIPGLCGMGARSFKADLTRFLTSEFVHTHLDDPDYRETLLDYFSVNSRTGARAAMNQAFFALDFADYSGCAHRHFRAALAKLDEIARVTPQSPAMLSRVFTNLAEAYIRAVKKDPGDACSGPTAKKALEHALKHDPDNLRGWLMQCDLLAMGRDTSAYHRFVDDLTKRLPEHKEVLIRNGDCCAGRKAYTKALRNFERAATIDAVDPRIARGILRAHLGTAEEAYKKRRPAKVNWEHIESLAEANNSSAEYPLWRLRVRRIILEACLGAPENDLVSLAAATLPLSPNVFLLESACRFGIVKSGLGFKAEVLEKMFPSRPTPESLADFLAVIDEADAFQDSTHRQAASAVARQIFAAHSSQLLRFVGERKDLTTLLIKVFRSVRPNLALASPVIQEWFHRDPADPVLRLLCASYSFPWLPSPLQTDRHELTIQLRDSHDPDILRLLMLMEKDSQRAEAAQYGGNHYAETPKLDLDYDPHENDECGDDEFDDFGDDYDDYDVEALADSIAAIDQGAGKMSPAKLLAVLGQVLGGGVLPGSGNSFDPLPYHPAPPKPPSKPPQKRPAPDPRQMSFDAEIIPPPMPPQP